MTMARDEEREAFWNSRAELGLAAGTNDLILKRLEMEAISAFVEDGQRILDVGCGNGVTALDIARRFDVEIVGLDYAQKMVEEARAQAGSEELKGSATFQQADLRDLPELGDFDLIYSERALINLPDWETQSEALRQIGRRLRPGATYVMCENSRDALERLNELRARCGLAAIDPPWHNRYFLDHELRDFDIGEMTLDRVENFTSTYYFLSRVVNAWLAEREGTEPDYDAPVNQLALSMPPIGDFGQTRLWVWRGRAGEASGTAT